MPKIDYSELNGVRLMIQQSRLQILSKFTDFDGSISSFSNEPNLSGDSWESAKVYLEQIPPVSKGIFNALSDLGEALDTYINSFHGEVGSPKNRLDSDKLTELNSRLEMLQSQKSDVLTQMKKAQDLVRYGPGQTLFGTSFGDMGLSSLNNSMEDISKEIDILEKYMTFEANHASDFEGVMDMLGQLKTGLSSINRSVSFDSSTGNFVSPTMRGQEWYQITLKFNEERPDVRREMVKSYRAMTDSNGRILGYEVVYEIYKNGQLDLAETTNMTEIMREAGIGEVGIFLLEVTGVNNFRRYFNGVDPITGEKLTTNEKSLAGLLGLLDAIGTVEAVKLLKNLNKGYAMLDNVKIPDTLKRTSGSNVVSKYDDLYIYKYNGYDNPGPLNNIKGQPNSNFYGGRYDVEVLKEPKIFYRAGDSTNPLGQWFTETPPESIAKVRIDTAVKHQWIDNNGVLTGTSKLDTVYKIEIPAGTTVYSGPVGNQGGIYQGGINVNQIYINKPWEMGDKVIILDSIPLK